MKQENETLCENTAGFFSTFFTIIDLGKLSRDNETMTHPRLDLRIISLIPSATEIIHALGATPYLVGRSHECDFPAEIASRPICSV